MLRITGLRLKVGEREAQLAGMVCARLGIKPDELLDWRISKKSIDARKKTGVYLVYSVDAAVRNEDKVWSRHGGKGVSRAVEPEYAFATPGPQRLRHRPIIVGTGPSGLFAGLILATMGYAPLILERGEEVEKRARRVENFWKLGLLNSESNALFGEGGAGTFSDGKLTTLTRDPRIRKVLEELVESGAPPEILYLNKPHLGTDLLRRLVKNLRQRIERLGGEVRFNSLLSGLEVRDNRVTGVVVNKFMRLPAEVVLLGIGHSARDTFAMLAEAGVSMTPKPFSVGLRVEHPQQLIDRAQYGTLAGHPALGAADYKLVYHSPGGRSAYTFCPCPGGYVVAASSEEGGVVTNGMSLHMRDGHNANSALLVGVDPKDFEENHPLAGVEFQRRWERLAFQTAGESYAAPVQRMEDFLAGRPSLELGAVQPTYRPGVVPGNLEACLPPYVISTLREAIESFDRSLKGFALPDAVLTGVETRSSSPVRILRDENYVASLGGLYPMGEGAGYAGGIVSSAVDGIRAAEKVAALYHP